MVVRLRQTRASSMLTLILTEFSQDQVTPLTSIDAIQEKKTSKVVPAVPAIKKRTCCGPTVSYVAPATTCHRSS